MQPLLRREKGKPMGSSADAAIAWGIDLGDPENTCEGFDWDEAGVDRHQFENEVMPGLFGFTEELPERPDGLDAEALREWWEANRKPYNDRLDAAVPLTFESYGYKLGGTALILKRSRSTVEWAAEAVDPATLAEPTPEELAAFTTVMDRLGYDGGEVKLLLMASYG